MKPTFKKSFPIINEKDLKWFEITCDILLPTDYRSFILKINGGKPYPSNFETKNHYIGDVFFRGLNRNPDFGNGENILIKIGGVYSYRKPIHLAENLLIIASDLFGNYVLMSLAGLDKGVIYWWVHDEGKYDDENGDFLYDKMLADPVASNFKEFINSAVIDDWDDEDEEDEEL